MSRWRADAIRLVSARRRALATFGWRWGERDLDLKEFIVLDLWEEGVSIKCESVQGCHDNDDDSERFKKKQRRSLIPHKADPRVSGKQSSPRATGL